MAQLLVRDLDDAVKRRLQERARDHGVSMEAEARAIITRAVGREGSRFERLRSAVEACGGVELDIPARSDLQRSIDLE